MGYLGQTSRVPLHAYYFFNVALTDGLTGRAGFDQARRLNQKSRGENLFRKCFTLCHSIGDGDRLDPIRPT